jgi:hypothetical protein
MSYPSSHPESLHPALLNAIYYSACSSPSFPSAYRDLFLYRAREEMRVSLSWCDRIEHWLYASIIIASVQSRIGSAGLVSITVHVRQRHLLNAYRITVHR